MFDVVAIGESLIDFTSEGENSLGVQLYARSPGGAPANVLAMCSRLGDNVAFIGKVGDDVFGHYLRKTMLDCGIDVSGLLLSNERNTTLAFVDIDSQGERSFSFYRKSCADVSLQSNELPMRLLHDCRIFHFGSVSLTDEPSRSATVAAVCEAREAGALISCDPNYRPPLWRGEAVARAAITEMLPYIDVLKVSHDEMALLTGEIDVHAGAAALAEAGPCVVFVTCGSNGTYFLTPSSSGSEAAYAVETIDTTGAGDAFFGAMLHKLRGIKLETLKLLTEDTWHSYTAYANAAGSLTTRAHGAIPAIPLPEEIEYCLTHTPKIRSSRV